MSVWKKASKLNQKTHKERHQPEERKHLGLLEKHKDYVTRAQDYNKKKETLKTLHKKALNKNPDEFYHHMINSKIVNDVHHEKETEDENTPEQLKIMQTQDLRYVVLKRTLEQKKIDQLQAQLHLLHVKHKPKNKHLVFTKNIESDERYHPDNKYEYLKKMEISNINVQTLDAIKRKQMSLYKELAKRIARERELAVLQQKLEMKKHIENKSSVFPPKRLKKGTKDSAPVYVWKYERKK